MVDLDEDVRQQWELSESSEEDFGDADGADENGEWRMEMIGEEVAYTGEVRYEVEWPDWHRADGTNTTFQNHLVPERKMRSWKVQQSNKRSNLAKRPEIEMWTTTDIHNENTRLRAQAFHEKVQGIVPSKLADKMAKLMAEKEYLARGESPSSRASAMPHLRVTAARRQQSQVSKAGSSSGSISREKSMSEMSSTARSQSSELRPTPSSLIASVSPAPSKRLRSPSPVPSPKPPAKKRAPVHTSSPSSSSPSDSEICVSRPQSRNPTTMLSPANLRNSSVVSSSVSMAKKSKSIKNTDSRSTLPSHSNPSVGLTASNHSNLPVPSNPSVRSNPPARSPSPAMSIISITSSPEVRPARPLPSRAATASSGVSGSRATPAATTSVAVSGRSPSKPLSIAETSSIRSPPFSASITSPKVSSSGTTIRATTSAKASRKLPEKSSNTIATPPSRSSPSNMSFDLSRVCSSQATPTPFLSEKAKGKLPQRPLPVVEISSERLLSSRAPTTTSRVTSILVTPTASVSTSTGKLPERSSSAMETPSTRIVSSSAPARSSTASSSRTMPTVHVPTSSKAKLSERSSSATEAQPTRPVSSRVTPTSSSVSSSQTTSTLATSRSDRSMQPSSSRSQTPKSQSPSVIRMLMQTQWNRIAQQSNAATISIVNSVDDEVPSLVSDFKYLETGYYDPNGYADVESFFFMTCDCRRRCDAKSCDCQAGSQIVNSKGKRVLAYTNDGFFAFNVPAGVEVIECNKHCRCSVFSCPNRISQRPRDVPIEIFKTYNRGWGVRPTIDVKKGKVLGIYTGELVRRADAESAPQDQKMYQFALDASEDPTSDGDEDQNEDSVAKLYTVDSMKCGNWSRFINHSCCPNLMVYPVVYDTLPETNLPYLAFVATEDIPALTEFTFDYNPAAGIVKRNVSSQSKRLIRVPEGAELCHCGARNCRGYMSTGT